MELNTAQRIAKNTLALLASEVIVRIFTFVITLLIARRLGAESFGRYSFTLAFVALFTVFTDLGINTLVIRNVARRRELAAKYLDNFILLKLLLGLSTFCLIFLLTQFVGKVSEDNILVYLAATWLILDSINMMIKAMFKAFEIMEYSALVTIVEKTIFFSLCIWVLLSSIEAKLFFIIAAYPFAGALTVVLGLFILNRKITKISFEIDMGFCKDMLKEGWPFAAMGMFGATYLYLDKVILKLIGGNEIVGWYSAGSRLFLTIYAVQSFYYQALFPVASKFFKESPESLTVLLERTSRLILAYTIPLTAGAIVLASFLIRLFYGLEYDSTVPVFQILLINIVVKGVNALYGGTILLVSDRQKDFMKAMGWGALMNILLNLLLIPLLSLKGAAIATVCSEAMVAIYSYVKAKKVLDIEVRKFALKPILSSLLMVLILCIFPVRNVLLLMFLGVFSFSLLMFLFKGITTDDIAFVSNSLRLRRTA